MDFKEIVNSRYATKKFDGKKIPQEQINELLNMIKLSASSFGLQPFKVQLITDQDTKEKLFLASWNQPQINTCSHLLVFYANTDVVSQIDKMEEMMKAAGAPEESTKNYIGMMRNFAEKMTEEQLLVWAGKQTYLAMGNAINGAKALGFDSCPMEGFDAVKYAEILDTPKNLVPLVIVPVGYAADTPRPKMRYEDLFF